MPKKLLRLTELSEGQRGTVSSLEGGRRAVQRLTDMGLTPGTEFKVLKNGFWCPVEVSVRGSDLALGRFIARKILVKVKE